MLKPIRWLTRFYREGVNSSDRHTPRLLEDNAEARLLSRPKGGESQRIERR
jgi:hypothetical protein